MSDYEFRTGKIHKIGMEDSDKEDFAKAVIQKSGVKERLWYDSWLELLREDGEALGYLVLNGDIYGLISDISLDPYEDMFQIVQKDKDYPVLEYTLKYYNGGCSYIEALETALNRKDKQD